MWAVIALKVRGLSLVIGKMVVVMDGNTESKICADGIV